MVDGAHLLTPSKITAWLDCPHYLTLKHQAEGGGGARPGYTVGSFARLLQDKGLEHEVAVEAAYVDAGLTVHRVDDKQQDERFADWAGRVADSLNTDVDVLSQVPLVHDGIRGVADFLERELDPVTGSVRWEPVDAKLARRAAKPGHVLQLCFYAEALGAVGRGGAAAAPGGTWLGHYRGGGARIGPPVLGAAPWSARRRHGRGAGHRNSARSGDHCEFCEFQWSCQAVGRAEDSLVYVAWIRKADRAALEAAGVPTMADLATRTQPVPAMRDERLARLQVQPELQGEARERPDEPPPYRTIPAGDDPVWGRGFERLPEPSGGSPH